MRRIGASVALFVVGVALSPVTVLAAASSYVSIPSIGGENPVPGYPGAMLATSLTIQSGGFSIVKATDQASPQIFAAVAGGTPLGTATVLLYNANPPGSADAVLTFPNTLASSYQTQLNSTEADGFASTVPTSLYLEIPGITGVSNNLGHPNVMQVDPFTLLGNTFSITKALDTATPQIFNAVASGTHFDHANLLLYNAAATTNNPYAIVTFHDVIGTSAQTGGGVGAEIDSFSFVTVTPEPGGFLWVAVAIAVVRARRRGN